MSCPTCRAYAEQILRDTEQRHADADRIAALVDEVRELRSLVERDYGPIIPTPRDGQDAAAGCDR